MRRFAALFETLDRTTSTLGKVAALRAYFEAADPADAAWALHFLSGRRVKRLLGGRLLHAVVGAATGLPAWLIDASHAAVGDAAETVALLLEPASPTAPSEVGLAEWIERDLLPLAAMTEAEKAERIARWARALPREELFLAVKMLTGALRVGVSERTVGRALAEAAGLAPEVIAGRLAGDWEPGAAAFSALVAPEGAVATPAKPYPFYLASPWLEPIERLGPLDEWAIEWKWDGIRAELIRRGGEVHIWSRGEELVTERFPEIAQAARRLPDGTVLDGEVLAFADGRPLPFAVLQRRIGRKDVSAAIRRRAPVVFTAFDLLETDGEDWRDRPFSERRARLAELLRAAPDALRVSEEVAAASWEEVAALRSGARERAAEGLVIKRRGSPYREGRRRGDWWKWKVDPHAIDAVLTHAQPGTGRRATVLTDYTFGVWDGEALVTVAKAYSGLSDAEIDELDRWLRAHTRARFGPVREVEPVHVFELAFDAVARSARHRAGVALRFPRIARWRRDKPAAEADTLEALRALIPPEPELPGDGQLALFGDD